MKSRAQITSLFVRASPMAWGILGFFATVVLPASGRAEGLSIAAEAQTRTEACAGAAASVSGSKNVVTFNGTGKAACTGLQIRGDNNTVTVSLAAGALIDIAGSHNKVVFSAVRGALPRLQVAGSFTELVPVSGSPAPSAETAIMSGDNQSIELDCASGAVTLQGVSSRFRLRGACKALTLRGEANAVQAQLTPAAPVLVEGNGMRLVYTVLGGGAEPNVTIHGKDSTAMRRDGVAATDVPSANAAIASVPVLMRDLMASVIQPGTLVPLPEAVFIGASLSPAGEAQLARLASLIDQINPVGLRLTSREADLADATGHGALVRAWLAAHGKKVLPVQEVQEIGQPGVDVVILR